MNDERPSLEERLIELMADFDDALAEGATSLPGATPDADLPPRLQKDLAYLQFLRQVLPPRQGPGSGPTDGPASIDTPPPGATPLPEGAPALTLPYVGADAAPGTPFSKIGRFVIRRELGRGGCGVVFLAHDPSLNRDVALKVPRVEALAAPEFRARFQREARATATFDHPNIVPVHEVGEVGPLCYIVATYCPGISLAEWIKRQTDPVPPHDAAALVQTLAKAVDHAHSRGVVHRDLKPGNVMMQHSRQAEGALPTDHSPLTTNHSLSAYQPKITDFGLAKLLEQEAPGQETQSGAILGTPQYMAPEQASGKNKEVGPAADVYALGAILYELLTSQPPFRGETPMDTLLQVQSAEPLPPTRLRPKLPRDLETICLKCLEKTPARRYTGAAELSDDLQRFLAGEPVRARPLGRLGRLARWCRRKPALATSGALSIVALAAAIGLLVSFTIADTLRWERDEKEQALKKEETARGEADRLRLHTDTLHKEAQKLSTRLAIERGRALCEQGNVASGLLWIARSLKIVPADDAVLADVIRTDLASWSRQVYPVRAAFTCTGYVETLSPDGKLVVSADEEGVTLWDVATGEPLPWRPDHSRPQQIVFSPDAKLLITAGAGQGKKHERIAQIWDIAAGKRRGAPLEFGGDVWNAAFSSDGTFLLITTEDEAHFFDPASGGPIRKPLTQSEGFARVVLSGNGKYLLAEAGDADDLRLWDVAAGKVVGKLRLENLAAMAISVDGQTVVGTTSKGEVRLWKPLDKEAPGDVEKPKSKRRDRLLGEHVGEAWEAAISPDGKICVTSGADGTARFWSLETGKALRAPLVHRGPVDKVTFSGDGHTLMTASDDGLVRFWETATGRPLGSPLQHGGRVETVVSGPAGLMILTTAPAAKKATAVRIWQAAGVTPKIVKLLGAHNDVQVAAISRDGLTVATADPRTGPLLVWEAATGRLLGKAPQPRNLRGLALSAGGKILAASGVDGKVWLREAHTAKQLGDTLFVAQHNAEVEALAFSPDGRRLLVGWHQEHKERQTALHVAAAPSGTRVGGFPMAEKVVAVAFSHDGETVLTASKGVVQRWSLEGKPIGKPLEHAKDVKAAAFSPDSRFIATVDDVGTVRLWRSDEALSLAAPLQPVSAARAVSFSPDGQSLITVHRDGSVQWWELSTPVEGAAGTLEGAAEQIQTWIEALTGMELTDKEEARELDLAAWQERRQRLEKLGGVPRYRPAFTPPPLAASETASLWSVETSAEQLRNACNWRLLAPSGRGVALYEEQYVLLDVLTAREAAPIRLAPAARGVDTKYWTLSADGLTLVVTPSGGPFTGLQTWDLATGKEGPPVKSPQRPSLLALSTDARTLAAADPQTPTGFKGPRLPVAVRVFDLATGAERAVFEDLTGQVMGLALSADGTLLAASALPPSPFMAKPKPGAPPAGSPIVLWDLVKNEKRFTLEQAGHVHRLAFAPGRPILATAGSSGVALWDTATGKTHAGLDNSDQVRALAFSADGQRLAVATSNAVRLWHVDSGRLLDSLKLKTPAGASLVFGADGQTLALRIDAGIQLWRPTP